MNRNPSELLVTAVRTGDLQAQSTSLLSLGDDDVHDFSSSYYFLLAEVLLGLSWRILSFLLGAGLGAGRVGKTQGRN